MKAIRAALLVSLGTWIAGCGPTEKAPVAPAPEVLPAPPLHTDASFPDDNLNEEGPLTRVRDAGGADAKAPPSPSGEGQLPPPRRTTIPLSLGKNDAADKELVLGDEAFEKNDLAAALSHYTAAQKADKKRIGAQVGIIRVKLAKVATSLDYGAYKGNREVAEAAKALRKLSLADGAFGPVFVELGRALLLLGDGPGALDALKHGALLLSDEAEAHSALGVAYLSAGRAEEALASLSHAVDLDPGSAARHGNLGTVYFMRGQVDEAIREYAIQARLADEDPRAHSDYGTALLARSDFQNAMRELERAIALDPKRATFRSNHGYALQLQGKLKEAIAEYREAIRLDPTLASAWINLATALSKDPKTRAEARSALEKAKKIDPSDPRVKANLEELDELEKKSPR